MVSLAPVNGFNKAKAAHDFARMSRGISFAFKKKSKASFPSLVIGSKSATPLETRFNPHFDYQIPNPTKEQFHDIEKKDFLFLDDSEEYSPYFDIDKSGKFLKVQLEEWSGRYTATTLVQGKACDTPPVQEGDRLTDSLSKTAATKIKKSAEFLSKHRRGFGAFLTLTFTDEERAILRAHDNKKEFIKNNGITSEKELKKLRKTIGARVTRFMKGMQQRRKEGVKIKLNPDDENSETKFIQGNKKGFEYIWVIENPKNKKGEDNPHIHVLTNWTVQHKHFKGWAHWMENLWGVGFANITKIKKPKSAAGYMAKAAGYIAKGGNGEQGTVRGNRYNISKGARAPKAVTLGLYAMQEINKLIKKGVELGRENWPKDMYFHDYGFGIKGKNNWVEFMQFVKDSGFQFITAADFHMVTYEQKIADYLKQSFKGFFSAFNNIESIKNEITEQLTLEDFNAMHTG